MPVQINGPLLNALIADAGGVEAFLATWLEMSPDPNDRVNKSNVSRWINGKAWPKDSRKFLRLAALLDVDPFALLVPDSNDPLSVADRIINIVQNRRSVPSAVAFMHDFFGRQKSWPPALDRGFSPWHLQEFHHDPGLGANHYALVNLKSDSKRIRVRPQAFHFAFRHPINFGARWLQYGCVFRHGLEASLWHINGHTEQMTLRAISDDTPVKTWFGPGPAIFRVASVHPFTLSTITEDVDGRPGLVFPG